MSITPAAPIPRPRIGRFAVEAISLRPVDRTVTIVVGVYDENGKRLGERRFDLTPFSVPSVLDYLAAVPAAANLRRQTELFMGTLDPEQTGEVD